MGGKSNYNKRECRACVRACLFACVGESMCAGVFGDHVWVEISLRNGDNLLCGCIYVGTALKERQQQ